jgi:hypothetical protein
MSRVGKYVARWGKASDDEPVVVIAQVLLEHPSLPGRITVHKMVDQQQANWHTATILWEGNNLHDAANLSNKLAGLEKMALAAINLTEMPEAIEAAKQALLIDLLKGIW